MLCEKRCQSMGYHGYVNNPPLKFPARKIKTGTVFAEFSGRRLKSIFLKCVNKFPREARIFCCWKKKST